MKKKNDLEEISEENIRKGLEMRARAKTLEDDAKTLKKEANELIESSASMLGIKKYSIEGIGTVTLKEGTSRSLNKTKLTEGLLKRGVDYNVVNRAIGEATKVSQYTTVEYRRK